MGDQHHTNMAGGGGAADAFVSSFKKFPYGTEHAVLREEGYRLATVYETEQLLEAIRSTEEGGKKFKAQQWNVVEHELVPEGEEEAYRLQDGYLLDFGTLRTFYRDTSDKFSITHKLCVYLSHLDLNDTRSIKLWLPLALLHACAEDDAGEIQWLVEEGTRIQGNISDIGLVSTTKEDDLLVQMQDPTSTESVQESTQGMTSTTTGEDDIASRGLALLCSGTPWLHGGTAFHFCAWAEKRKAARCLVDMERRLVAEKAKENDCSRMLFCKDNEGNNAFSWAASALSEAEAKMQALDEVYFKYNGEKIYEETYIGSVNVFGSSSVVRAAKEGDPMTLANDTRSFITLYQSLRIESVRETHAHLFNQLDGNSFLHYLVLRPDFRREHLDLLQQNISTLAEFAFGIENHMGSTVFQVALSRGRSEVCEWLLHRYPGSAPEFASRALALRDCEGRNMLHLYAEGGASKEVGSMILERLKEAEEEPTDLSLPLFLRRAKDAARIKDLLDELNAHGDTPCTIALRKGHSNALQMLMPWWGEEPAMRYRHPLTEDNILHCYAESAERPGAVSFEWSSFFSAPSSLQMLLSARNSTGRTPLISAYHYAKKTSPGIENSAVFACLLRLQQGDSAEVFGSWRSEVLDVYAIKFDNEELAKEVLQKLGRDVERPENGIKSALISAIENGHARTCDAFLAALGGRTFETSDKDALLRALLDGMGNITDPQDMWEKLKPYIYGEDRSKFAHHVSANTSMYADALVGALTAGNVKACGWLLDYIQAHAGVGALSGYIIENKHFIDRVFESYAEGDCEDQNLWEKLRDLTSENVQSPSTSSWAASPAAQYEYEIQSLLTQSVFTHYGGPGVDCALCFLRNPGLAASTSLRWMSWESLQSFKVLAHMKRHKYYCHIFHRPDILQLSLEFENFELFDMALQWQTRIQQNENLSADNVDQLIAAIISEIPLRSSDCFLQVLSMRLAEEKCSPLIISRKRLVEDIYKNRSIQPKGWLWASVHSLLAGSPSSTVGNESADIDGSTAGVETGGQQHAASRPEGSKAVVTEQREKVSQVPPSTEQRQRAYLGFAEDIFYSRNPEVLALGNIIVKQGPNSPTSYSIQLLRKMKRPNPAVLAQMLFLIGHDRENEAAPGFDALLPELLNAFTEPWDVGRGGTLLQTLLYHAVTHQKSFAFLKFKMFLASSASLWTDRIMSRDTVQNRTTLLHHLVLLKRDSTWARELAGALINVFHYFRFFQVEDVRDQTGATALHVACREQNEVCARVLLAMSPKLATLGRRTGKTALHDSAHSGYLEIVKEILRFRREANALLDERDADGKTALHFAAASRSPKSIEIVKLLLAHAKENGDYAALLLWASAGSAVGTADRIAKDPAVARLLRREKKNVSKTAPNLLEFAISKGSDVMKRELINRGAQIQPEFLEGIQETLDTTKESDQPAKTDSLGRGPLAKGIAALLLNPFTAVPITVGVFGPWGMGKSSVMLQTEIAMLMTMIENNLLPLEPSTEDDFPGSREQREDMTRKGKEICHQLRTALHQPQSSASYQHSNFLSSRPLISTVSTRIKLLFTKLQKKLFFWSCWTKKIEKSKKDKKEILQDFVSNYNEELKPLYKGLSLMDRQDLFRCHSTLTRKNVIEIPSCITIFYNAWLYFGEKEASSGLAFTVMKELEECLTTAQWLRLCWRYAYKSNPIFFFTNITLPLIVWLALGGWVLWIMWELLSLPSIANNQALNNFRYGSLPVAMVISTWVILRNILNVVKPVSEQVFKSLHTKNVYEAKLGYHQQIIDDIEFFKEELCKVPSFGWKYCGKFWSIFVENKDNITPTKIKKPFISKKNLRIVVFVDDIDRCTESTYILQLLGAINLILSVCSINVIIGMDKGMVEQVLKSAYQENRESAQKFLEKIIQLPVYLNEASEQEMSRFVKEHLLGRQRSASDDSTSLKGINDSFTTKTRSFFAITSNTNHSNEEGIAITSNANHSIEDNIAIITEIDLQLQELSSGQHNNTILSATNLSRASTSGASNERDSSDELESSNDVEAIQNRQDLDGFEGHGKLAIKSHLLVPNYTETELQTFSYLQSRAKVEHRQPRNWKRFLNYHRLAWYVISQTKSRILRVFDGWQVQLIVWVFICYNWEDEMNEIFENWKELLKEISPEGTRNDSATLHELISLHMNKKKDKTESMKEWKQFADTVSSIYDIDIKVGIFFQNYRFYCVTSRLDWEE